METLADSLPKEINRVRELQDNYKKLRELPNCICEPQIMMMENLIQKAITISAHGDVLEMLKIHEELKSWQE